ncbi:MAG: hypothetical protein JWN04_1830, partial [Myxococcaceae bacterium]|nr:hypothetical protein [Myxococcaceae bacterium]
SRSLPCESVDVEAELLPLREVAKTATHADSH